MYGDLVLEDRDRGDAPTELAAPVLAEKVVDGTLKLVKWNDAVEQWIRRLNGLSVWMPELELPRFSEEDKLVAISLVCEGAVGYKDIKEREIIPVLRDWLSGWQAKALDDYAPVSLTLPNGQHAQGQVRGGFLPGDQSDGAAPVRRGSFPTHCQRGRTRDCGGAGPQPEAVAGNGISGKFLAERIRANEKGPGGALSPAPLARPRGTGFPSPFPVIRRKDFSVTKQ